MEPSAVQRGLEDVVALESRICFIDGRQGRLIYRGYDIRELTARSTFEEVAVPAVVQPTSHGHPAR